MTTSRLRLAAAFLATSFACALTTPAQAQLAVAVDPPPAAPPPPACGNGDLATGFALAAGALVVADVVFLG